MNAKAGVKARQVQKAETQNNKSKSGKIAFLIFYIILAAAAIYSVKFYVGISAAGDDAAYSNFAYYVSRGGFGQSSDSLSVRIIQYYPIAFFYIVSNYSFYASADWDIFAYIATIAIVFYMGGELYNEYAGALASLLFASFPAVAILSTTMSDNPTVLLFASFTMLSLLYATRKKNSLWYIVAGMSVIAGIAVMPLGFMALAIAVFYFLFEFIRGKLDRTAISFVLGIIIGLAILSTFNYINAKNPIVTFTTTFNYFGSEGGTNHIVPANGYLLFYPNNMFPYKIASALGSSFSNHNFNPVSIWKSIYTVNYNWVGFYFYVVVLAMLYLLYKRERRACFAFFWLAMGFLLMEFDPVHISLFPLSYILQHRLERYITFIVPPTVLLISIAIMRLVDSAKGRFKYAAYAISGAVIVFLVVTGMPIITLYHNALSLEGSYSLGVARYIEMHSNSSKEVYLIGGAGSFIPTYMKFNNMSRISTPESISCHDIRNNSYVVVQRYGQYNNTPCSSWELVYNSSTDSRYRQTVTGPALPFELDLYSTQ